MRPQHGRGRGSGNHARAVKTCAYTIARGEAVQCAAALQIAALLGDAHAEDALRVAVLASSVIAMLSAVPLMTNGDRDCDPFPYPAPSPYPAPARRHRGSSRTGSPLRFARPEHYTLRIQPLKHLVLPPYAPHALFISTCTRCPPHDTTATFACPGYSTSSLASARSPPSRAIVFRTHSEDHALSRCGPPEPRARVLRWP